MPVQTDELRPYLYDLDFRGLFVDVLGWDHPSVQTITMRVGDREYALDSVAEKAGFAVYACSTDGDMPDYPARRKIEQRIAKIAFEHMIIFVDATKSTQVWQLVRRETGKSTACREHTFHAGQSGERLLQRLRDISFTLDEEVRGIGIVDVVSRVRAALDVEKVTKRFYDRFRTELISFRGLIAGIPAQNDRERYASVMLNRMMFVYFVQKRGFLDGNTDYLRERLGLVQRQAGDGKFHQFYRVFLLRLFHEGLGRPESQRAPELVRLLGRVPFLNGGLFDVHDLERDNPDISIPDEAFRAVFDFFDDYVWHLDERPRRADNEINPDVLGYIFEKYVNQKEMGAYYTKEDITGYIARNAVVPRLLDTAGKCPGMLNPDGYAWRLLRDEPDRYTRAAAGHGLAWEYSAEPKRLEMSRELPDDIAAGLDDVSRRGGWNRPPPPEYALPTETWRETVARRRHYEKVRERLASGGVRCVNDLVTLNLDIERFAKDVILQSREPGMLRALWRAVRGVSVLDPTCGSGAFLFAALNVLEPLYAACLEGMRGFVDDSERTGVRGDHDDLDYFYSVLEKADGHPNLRYFILKSIILNNIYGVDIMEDAVEICKLRLFLKMVAQLERYEQIEPLPDIDFNVRAGNALVGFTSLDAVRRAMRVTPKGYERFLTSKDEEILKRIDAAAKAAGQSYEQFRDRQTARGMAAQKDKDALRYRLGRLRDELDRYMAVAYKVDAKDAQAYAHWRSSHRPLALLHTRLMGESLVFHINHARHFYPKPVL